MKIIVVLILATVTVSGQMAMYDGPTTDKEKIADAWKADLILKAPLKLELSSES